MGLWILPSSSIPLILRFVDIECQKQILYYNLSFSTSLSYGWIASQITKRIILTRRWLHCMKAKWLLIYSADFQHHNILSISFYRSRLVEKGSTHAHCVIFGSTSLPLCRNGYQSFWKHADSCSSNWIRLSYESILFPLLKGPTLPFTT